MIERAYNRTHPDDKTILVGRVPNKGDNSPICSLPLHFNKVQTSPTGDAVAKLEIPRYIRLMDANKIILDVLITHEFVLDEINEVLDLFQSGEAGRITIKIVN